MLIIWSMFSAPCKKCENFCDSLFPYCKAHYNEGYPIYCNEYRNKYTGETEWQ